LVVSVVVAAAGAAAKASSASAVAKILFMKLPLASENLGYATARLLYPGQ
jgi:hypothetical protein